ncbi:MAG: glycosyltransferase [Alphaproteobacteria bacterium]
MTFLALLSLAAWLWLLFRHGDFWKASEIIDEGDAEPEKWPAVVAVIPARDEAPTIGRTVQSLLAQDYPGKLSVIVVDDASGDGTTEAAGKDKRLKVISGEPLPDGWTGKLWAVEQGIRASGKAPYVLLTDADIDHGPGSVRRLISKAEAGGFDLVSLMVRLNCESLWERLLIPAFVFFFQMLYPFPWVNDRARPTAAAAGGCMLVRREALEAAGGIKEIADRVIDDCALAALLKPRGPIWLGLTDDVVSLREYHRLDDIWRMVTRTAYAQLGYSPVMLVLAVAGMLVVYAAPPLLFVFADAMAAKLAAIAWGCMVVAYQPMLSFYKRPLWEGLALPLAGLLYMGMTISSVLYGGSWKGRRTS